MAATRGRQCERCAFCRRCFDEPHPFPHILQASPGATLPRRASRSKECRLCAEFLTEEYPTQVDTATKKRKFSATLVGAEWEKFDAKRASWEEKRRERGRGRPVNGSSPRRTRSKQADERKKVLAKESTGTEYRTRVGCFWPKKVYQKYFPGRKIARRRKRWFKGVEGIILDGLAYQNGVVPDMVTEIFSTDMKFVTKAATLHDDSDESSAVREGVADNIFQRASELMVVGRKTASMRQSSAASTDGDGCIQHVKLQAGMPCGMDDSDDRLSIFRGAFNADNLLEWGGSDKESSSDSHDGEERGRKAKKKHTAKASQDRSNCGEKPPKKTRVSDGNKDKALTAGEWNRLAKRAAFDAEEQLGYFGESGLKNVSRPKFEKTFERLQTNIDIYIESTQDLDDQGDWDEGVLINLKMALATMEAVLPFLQAWQPAEGTTFDIEKVAVEASALAKNSVVPLPMETIRLKIYSCRLDDCLTSDAHVHAGYLISGAPTGADAEDATAAEFNTSSEIEDAAEREQAQRVLFKQCLEFFAEKGIEHTQDTRSNLRSLLHSVNLACVCDQSLKVAIDDLDKILDPNSPRFATNDIASALESVAKKDNTLTSGFVKSEFGRNVLASASRAKVQRQLDDKAAADLAHLQILPPLDIAVLKENFWRRSNSMGGVPLGKWKSFRSARVRILAGTSDSFQDIYSKLIEATQHTQHSSFHKMVELVFSQIVTQLGCIVKVLTPGLEELLGGVAGDSAVALQEQTRALDGLCAELPTTETLSLQIFEPPEHELSKVAAKLELFSSVCVGVQQSMREAFKSGVSAAFVADAREFALLDFSPLREHLEDGLATVLNRFQLAVLKSIRVAATKKMAEALHSWEFLESFLLRISAGARAGDAKAWFSQVDCNEIQTVGTEITDSAHLFCKECSVLYAEADTYPVWETKQGAFRLHEVAFLALSWFQCPMVTEVSSAATMWNNIPPMLAMKEGVKKALPVWDALPWKGEPGLPARKLCEDGLAAVDGVLDSMATNVVVAAESALDELDRIVEAGPLKGLLEQAEAEAITKDRAKFFFQNVCTADDCFQYNEKYSNMHSILLSFDAVTSAAPTFRAPVQTIESFYSRRDYHLKMWNSLMGMVALWRAKNPTEKRSTIASSALDVVGQGPVSKSIHSLLVAAKAGRPAFVQ